MPEPTPEVSAVVLAGGEGRRMGGDKPLAPFRGRPLVAWALDAVAWADETLVACGPAPPARALREALEGRARLVHDGGTGPAAGLLAAARTARGEWLLVAPCDAPLLSESTYRALLAAACAAPRGDGAVAEADGVVQPLVGAFRRATLTVALEAAGAAAGVRGALARLRLRRVAADALADHGADALRDADTADDLARLEARVHGRRGRDPRAFPEEQS